MLNHIHSQSEKDEILACFFRGNSRKGLDSYTHSMAVLYCGAFIVDESSSYLVKSYVGLAKF